ncbi:DUF2274 domain-containing protein [Sphingopyxis sp. A083]|uniref:DUF2274 domain-containing protein n=1 Tax=Sphingopyxis sp. A083 TaxID=1759083 RepID=UPI000736A114|nr:DUF2274 domain-containing protein [Sphingopyxis sp. A083]KTE76862.1 transposase [Sphingopyxis sp. A083]
MAELKLPRLPDRRPIKITISVMPDLIEALNAYAEAYEVAYGRRESVPDLIPFMLSGFLASDRSFSRARKK